jgi:hypothetical protein
MGYMIWQAIKQAALDLWDEAWLLIIFNIFWLIGAVLIIPMPFVTFALFAIVYDIGQNKGVTISKFFTYGWQARKQAYIWGGINLIAYVILVVNYNFYGNLQASWGASVQLLFAAMLFVWSLLQLIALAIYPRMEEPGVKLVWRNAAVVLTRYPLAVLILVGLIVIFGVITFIVQIIGLLLTFSLIAVLTNRMVEAMVKKELERGKKEEEKEAE